MRPTYTPMVDVRMPILCLLLGGFALASCSLYDPDDYEVGDLDAVLQFDVSPASLRAPADGATAVTLSAEIPRDADDANRTVTFTTEAGVFENGERSVAVRADTDGVAEVELRAPLNEREVEVTAAVASFARDTVVTFERAQPEQISLELGAFALAASYSSTTTVVAVLDRDPGTPTLGTPVEFTAQSDSGAPIGSFRAVTVSDSAGRATAIFTVGPDSYRGPATIRARADGEDGVLTATATIEVITP